MLHIPRRAVRAIAIYFVLPLIFLTVLLSRLGGEVEGENEESEQKPRAIRDRIGLSRQREQGIRNGWEGVKRIAGDTADYLGINYDDEDDHSDLEARWRAQKGIKQAPANAQQQKREQHTYLPNGLMEINEKARHPIYDLIERGKAEWDKKHKKQSRTLDEAIREYRRRYHRSPPKGFDKWWNYVEKHKVPLPDEYDMIYRDLQPFHGMSSRYLRNLQTTWESIPGTYVLECNPTSKPKSTNSKFLSSLSPDPVPKGCHLAHSTYTGNKEERTVGHERAAAQLSLLKEVESAFTSPLRVTFYAHDGPFQMIGHDYKSSLADAAAVEEHINPHEHDHDLEHRGWGSACPPHEPINEEDLSELPTQDTFWKQPKSFIWDHKTSMDPCKHPYLSQAVGFLSAYGKGPPPAKDMYPVLSMCSTKLHADVTAVSMEAFVEEAAGDIPWEEKENASLLWRGSTTGILFDDSTPWNISQRARLIHQANAQEGTVPMLRSIGPDKPIGSADAVPVKPLNDVLLDIGFAGEPIQCSPKVCNTLKDEYLFKSRMPFSDSYKYKYLYDIDGNGFSARYKRLITTNSLLLKTTIFPEWYQDRIQPWVHYVPVKTDLTDLYDIMAFFRGTDVAGTDGHDGLAKEIAMAGKTWSQTYWRKEDMVAYQFRMFLELARLMAKDRSSMDYSLPDAEGEADVQF